MYQKIVNLPTLLSWRFAVRDFGKSVVFTNGCFDILHRGHVDLLRQAKALGDCLVVGLNTDGSVRKIKGPSRPLVMEGDRAEVLAALEMVDQVVLFADDNPGSLIDLLVPDVLVKGDDWKMEDIIGRETVVLNGGRVVLVKITPGYSTTSLARKIQEGA